MRRSSPYLQRQGDVSIQMTPLIDVVFLLMVFFVWTAGFQVAEYMLPSHLAVLAGAGTTSADAPPPPQEDFDKVVVRVMWVAGLPTWKINDTSLETLQEVRSRLEGIVNIKRDAPVVLHPDQEVPLGHVIDLYDLARRVGFTKIQFVASEKI